MGWCYLNLIFTMPIAKVSSVDSGWALLQDGCSFLWLYIPESICEGSHSRLEIQAASQGDLVFLLSALIFIVDDVKTEQVLADF